MGATLEHAEAELLTYATIIQNSTVFTESLKISHTLMRDLLRSACSGELKRKKEPDREPRAKIQLHLCWPAHLCQAAFPIPTPLSHHHHHHQLVAAIVVSQFYLCGSGS